MKEMTILEMLESRCDFQKNHPVSGDGKGMDDLIGKLPEDAAAFYREADGGWGRLDPECSRERPDFVLYSRKALRENRDQFLREAPGVYEEMCRAWDRSPEEGAIHKFEKAAESLVILGECGCPECPAYLVFCKDTFVLLERIGLEDFLEDWPPENGECAVKGSYQEFLRAVLWYYEISELEYPDTDPEEAEKREGQE